MTEASADLKNLQALLHTAASRLAYVTKLLESCGENERKELQEEMVLFESELRRIHDASEAGKDIQVPLRLVEHIDQGKSTDSFVKELIVEAQARNQEARGRTAALEELQGHLLKLVGDRDPAVLQAYMDIDAARAQRAMGSMMKAQGGGLGGDS